MASLVVNPGSSSKKFALYEGGLRRLRASYERTPEGVVRTVTSTDGTSATTHLDSDALETALADFLLVVAEHGAPAIDCVGVRVVAPGDRLQRHERITEEYLDALRAAQSAVPLHVPATLAAIGECREALPQSALYGLSDSAFHSTIPAHRREYSLRTARENGIKKYGYHGFSVCSIVSALPDVFGDVPTRVVVAHVGSGVSVTALKGGESMWTTMGYTPASGLMMSSRAGDIDPGALIEVLAKTGADTREAHRLIEKEGGFEGLLGTSDLREVLARAAEGDQVAVDALESFVEGIAGAVARGAVALGGIDALVFTGTAAERSEALRTRIVSKLAFLGVALDQTLNMADLSRTRIISPESALVRTAVFENNEMGAMVHLLDTLLLRS